MVLYATDIETEGLDASRYVLGATKKEDGTQETYHTPTEHWNQLKKHINNNKTDNLRTYIYGHNHSFDFSGYIKEALIHDQDIHIISTKTFLVRYGTHGWLLDTYPFYKMSLEKAGEIVGEKKLRHPTAFGKQPTTTEEDWELRNYCLQDCNVTLKLMLTLKTELGKLGFKPRKMLTPGQTAMTCYQTWYKKQGLPWKHIYEYINDRRKTIKSAHPEDIRKAYRGGIVRAFKTGSYHDVTYVDKRALYPWIMSTMRFPDLRTEERIEQPLTKGYRLKELLNTIGISRATIKTPKKTGVPLLPVRDGHENTYPWNGERITANYTHQELATALQAGYTIEHIYWSITYADGPNPFTNYMQLLYQQRTHTTNAAAAHAIKLLMNSLSGKFAQENHNKDIKIVKRADADHYFKQGYTPEGTSDIYYLLEKDLGTYTPSYANPLISALITAGGRIYTWQHLQKIPHDKLLYCDTDGIFYQGTNAETYFDIGPNLTQWKIENQGKDMHIRGKKSKLYDGELSVSGLKATETTPNNYLQGAAVNITRTIGILQAAKQGDLTLAGTPITKTFTLADEQEPPRKKHYIEEEQQP